jgi:hypothetical protein
VYHITAEGMHFTVMETLRASRVEMWIRAVKQQFLDAAMIKCVGLHCEFTSPREGRSNQRATVLQLSAGVRGFGIPDMFGQSRATAAQRILEGHHHQILQRGYHQ